MKTAVSTFTALTLAAFMMTGVAISAANAADAGTPVPAADSTIKKEPMKKAHFSAHKKMHKKTETMKKAQ